jgi:hypothetical protein
MDFLRVPGQILRKLSVFYLFAILLAASLGLYYWGIIPRNKAELNQRAHRVLNQMAENFLKKDENISIVFDMANQSMNGNLFKQSVERHQANFESLDNLDYKASVVPSSLAVIGKYQTFSFIERSPEGKEYWATYKYIYDSAGNKTDSLLFVRIPVRNMLGGLLATRTDIFDSYLILENDTTIKANETGRRPFGLLYAEDPITHSPLIYADTLRSLLKNSDGSATAPISISGRNFTAFFRPFRLNNQQIILTGLIEEDTYSQKAHQTPIDFIPICLILIILILVALPISKVFLLSPKERIGQIDVLGIAFSYYAGTIIICLILFYTSHQFITGLTFSNRVRDLGNKIKCSVERTFAESNARLLLLDTLKPDHGEVINSSLINDDPISGHIAKLAGRHTQRLFWFDEKGHTIAKWNAFQFLAPNSNVNGLPFFENLREQQPAQFDSSFNIITVGKSNITEEFQVYLSKPSSKLFNARWVWGLQIADTSFGVAEAMDLDITNLPVIPAGFGYYVTDLTGNVLICNNPDRNLAENILEESGNNATLISSLNRREQTGSFPVSLYGHSCVAMVWPIQGQNLHLIVYYDQHLLSANFMRMLLFGILSLFFMLFAISLCVWFSVPRQHGVRRLRFPLSSVEWIQPTDHNAHFYNLTFRYYWYQLMLFLLFYFLLSLTGESLESLYTCSVLFPFYAIWAFFYSRTPVKPNEKTFRIFTRCKAPPVFILALNGIIVLVHPNLDLAYWAWTLGIQLLLLFLLIALEGGYAKNYSLIPGRIKKHASSYNASLMFSMVVCCIIPVTGILTYAYQAEKIQYKKEKLFSYTQKMQEWERFVYNEQAEKWKKDFREDLGSCAYRHIAYMTDGDSIQVLGEQACTSDSCNSYNSAMRDTIQGLPPVGRLPYLPDNLYTSIINRFTDGSELFGRFRTIGDSASDRSWLFWQEQKKFWKAPTLRIRLQTFESGIGIPVINASSRLRNILSDFIQLPWAFRIGIILFFILSAFFMRWVITETTRRLFLVKFIPGGLIVNSGELASIFNEEDIAHAGIPGWDGYFSNEFDEISPDRNHIQRVNLIIGNQKKFEGEYNEIWLSLTPEERYVLFDFAIDGFSSYRNMPVLIMLVEKGIIEKRRGIWELFSLSFKEHILDKKDSKEIIKLEKKYRVAGNWAVLRVSILSLVAVAGILIIATQGEISHQVLATVTSVTALLPLLARFLTKNPDEKAAESKGKNKSGGKKDKKADEKDD